jgi:cysteine synthase A
VSEHQPARVSLIGNTPLIHLRQASELTGCTILGKAEFLNPGGSMKDRTALGVIRDAERTGMLEPGGTIVEGTAGNTGIGLCLVARALREQDKSVSTVLMDAEGAALCNYYRHGESRAQWSSVMEGIGQSCITANLEGLALDDAQDISDHEALPYLFDLLQYEGLCLGGSSGTNVAGAVQVARMPGPGHTVVTTLGDVGSGYQSKLFNPAFLCERGLPLPPGLGTKT